MSSRWDIDDEFVRLTNTWGVVQAYYVGYHTTQALIVARGDLRPSSHPRTQSMFGALWSSRKLELPPWTLGVGHGGPTNVPSSISIDPNIHGWSRCDNDSCWSLTAKAVRTSRDEKLKEAIRNKRFAKQRERSHDWDLQEAVRLADGKRARSNHPESLPLLTATEKIDVNRSVRTFTVLDYLYRLRIRANYEDVSLFTEGPSDDIASIQLNRHLRYIAASTSLVTELRIRELVGNTRFMSWADAFISHNVPARISIGIAMRREIFN